MNLHAGSAALTGWQVINGDVAWGAADAYGLTTPYGTHSLDLTGSEQTAPGGVRQTFATTAGQAYQLRFSIGYGSTTSPSLFAAGLGMLAWTARRRHA